MKLVEAHYTVLILVDKVAVFVAMNIILHIKYCFVWTFEMIYEPVHEISNNVVCATS